MNFFEILFKKKEKDKPMPKFKPFVHKKPAPEPPTFSGLTFHNDSIDGFKHLDYLKLKGLKGEEK
jgi:hypothetical protein